MSISLHSASVETYLQTLPAVASLIDKAEAWCREHGQPDTALTQESLAPDMWPFAKQVMVVAAHSAGTIRALEGGTFGPDLSPAPTDFASLRAAIADAIAYLRSVDPDEVNARAGHDMDFAFGERRMPFTAETFVLSFSLPNFFFHASAAYAILRAKGLPVGKGDFLGQMRMRG